MPIKYIVLSESNHYGWVGGFTTLAEAKKMMKIETETFYIFKHVHKKTEPFQMKKEVFEEYDNYVINTPDDTCDNGSLILTLQQQLQTQQQLQRQQTEIFYIFKHIHKKTEETKE